MGGAGNMRKIPLFFLCIGMLTSALTFAADTQKELHVYLAQNWTEQERQYFYFANQGSSLLPYDYFLHLEMADKKTLFRSDENLLTFGLIPSQKSQQNPDGLPIGFVRNKNHVGPTCAACHTQQLNYKNNVMMIDGGQSYYGLSNANPNAAHCVPDGSSLALLLPGLVPLGLALRRRRSSG